MSRVMVVTIGPTPPPYNGMSVATELVTSAIGRDVNCIHLDTADRRGLSNIGKFELGNLKLALLHGLRYLWMLLTKRPQVIYVPIAQAWMPFLRDCLFLIPAKLTKRRVVVHLHGGYFGTFYRQSNGVMRFIIRFALSDVSSAVVLGRSVQRAFEGIVPNEKVRIIPNGIPDYFVQNDRAAVDKSPSVVLYLGTLMAQKGFLDVLRALPSVRERIGSVRAIFAGEWFSEDDKKAAEKIVEKYGLAQNVSFIGPVGPKQKMQLLRDADIFVFPTAYSFEGHPYVVLEAMAAGLPIISTNWACIPEMIENGVGGYLVNPGDAEKLSEKMSVLLRDGELSRQMGRANRKRFLSEFTFDSFSARMIELFNDVCVSQNEKRNHAVASA